MSAFRSMEPIASSVLEWGSIFFFRARVFRVCRFGRGRGSNSEAMILEKSLICLRDMGLLDIVQ